MAKDKSKMTLKEIEKRLEESSKVWRNIKRTKKRVDTKIEPGRVRNFLHNYPNK